MAWFRCADCGKDAHFEEFVVRQEDEALEDQPDEADLECPSCGSSTVYEE